MARTNTLSNFLTDVANAIRTKKGTETTIAASAFDTEILNLPSGTYQTKNITISANGSQTITPDQGYDAIDEITITTQVPQKQLQSKTYNFNTNQTVELTPDTGYDGFDIITLTINVPGQQINNQDKTITENGTYTADSGYTGLGEVTVNVPSQINNQNKTIIENGTYTADSGYTGLGTVDVNVEPDVRLFQNKTEVDTYINQHYSSLVEGKKLVIYGEEKIEPIAQEERYTELYLPPEIVLTTPCTRDIIVDMQSESSGGSGGGTSDVLTPTGISMWLSANMAMAIVGYSSEDGITYTRTQVETENYQEYDGTWTWNAETNVLKYTPYEGDEENGYKFFYKLTNGGLEQLIQVFRRKKPTFDGIYQYNYQQLDSYNQSFAPAINIVNNNMIDVAEYGIVNGFTNYGSDTRLYGKVTATETKQGKTVYKFNELYINPGQYMFKDGNTVRIGNSYTGGKTVPTDNTSRTVTVRKRLLDGTEQTETKTVILKNAPYFKNSYGYYTYFIETFNFPYNEINDWKVSFGKTWSSSTYVPNTVLYLTAWVGTSSPTSTSVRGPATFADVAEFWTYNIEPTQMSLTNNNQLLPGLTGYGVGQSYTGDGSIYNNLEPYDVLSRIYGEDMQTLNGAVLADYANTPVTQKLSYIKTSSNLSVPDGYYGHNSNVVSVNTNEFVAPTGWTKSRVFADIKYNLLFGLCYQNSYSDTSILFVVENATTKEVLLQQQISYQLNYGTSRYQQDDKYVYLFNAGTSVNALWLYNKLTGEFKTVFNRTGTFKSDNGYGWMSERNNHCFVYGINNSSAGYTTYVYNADTNTTTTIETSSTGALQNGNLMSNSTTLYWIYNSKLTIYNVSTRTFNRVDCAYMMYAGAYGNSNPYALEDTYDYLFYYSHYIAKKSVPTQEYRNFNARLILNNEVIASSTTTGYPRQKGNTVYMSIGNLMGVGQLVVANDMSTVDIICDKIYYTPTRIPTTTKTNYVNLNNPTPESIIFENDKISYDYNVYTSRVQGWFKNYELSNLDDYEYMLLPANPDGYLAGFFTRTSLVEE